MNHIYSLIWNPATQSYCPAPEFAHSRHKGRNSKLVLALAIAAIAGGAQAAPTGGDVVSGSATISAHDTTTVINQTTDAVTINWQGFNIDANETVTFYQPDANSLALNRVLSGNGTEIQGQLNANGRVFILDANGVLFGETAQVNVGSLVASTLDLSSADFANNHFEFSGSGNPAAVTNLGQITVADTGAVALLGGQVTNHGVIRARLGNVALAAGNQITLDFAGDGLLNVKIDEGTAQALVHNGGLIQADGGSVLMTAHASDALLQTVVNNTGVIEARTLHEQDGKIMLLGGFNGGTVKVGGTLDASAPDGGDGGFIDTSGAVVSIQNDLKVTTAAADGKTGIWLIDPTDLEISYEGTNDGSSHVSTQAIQNSLATTSIIVQTVAAGAQPGNITVVDPIIWASANTLTLQAHNNIAINDYIHAPSGGLTINAGGNITTGAEGHVNVGRFTLQTGNWTQVSANLPIFNAANFTLADGVIFTRAAGGSGTGGSPWRLTDIYGLQGLNTTPTASAILVNNIDASGTASWNSNAGFVPIADFSGSLNGQGFVVAGLTINRAGEERVGLFGNLTGSSTISNIGLTGLSVTGANNVGGLVGVNFGGNISQGYVSGDVSGANYVGGLVGVNVVGSITQSYSLAQVDGVNDVGGLVGRNQPEASISHSYATGNVDGTTNVGGLVGHMYGGDLLNSYATGAVSGDASVGGLVGTNALPGTILVSYASGNVTGTTDAGGLVGTNAGIVNESYWDGFTSGLDVAGAGSNSGTFNAVQINGNWAAAPDAYSESAYVAFDFNNDWFIAEGSSRPMLRAFLSSDGSISNLYQLQGMAADLNGSYTLTQDIDASPTAASVASGNFSDTWGGRGFAPVGTLGSEFTGSLDGQSFVIHGLTIDRPTQDYVGLFGYTGGTASIVAVGLEGSSVTGNGFVGGVVGYNLGDFIQNYSTGAVTGGTEVGGLVGWNHDDGTIEQSYATGAVTGTGFTVGGLVGNNNGAISQSYATGEVTGVLTVGGLVGNNNGTISQSYATGEVDGIGNTGGLVGWHNGSIDDSYWDSFTTGQADAVGGGPGAVTDTDAVNGDWVTLVPGDSAYSAASYDGFDFNDIWFIAEGSSRPMLRAFLDGGNISNLYQLQGMAANPGGSYTLTQNIDALATAASVAQGNVGNYSDTWGGRGFAPVGHSDSANSFTGSLNGNGFVIGGLTINRDNRSYVGLFGRTQDASLTGVVLENAAIIGGTLYTGALVGSNNASNITQSYATGLVAGEGSVGGLVGVNSVGSNITQSYSVNTVTGGSNVGGLAGVNNSASNITQSYAIGTVTGQDRIGGLVGTNQARIEQSYTTATVSGNNEIGGLVGLLIPGGAIVQSYASGTVTSPGTWVGGLVGRDLGGAVTASFWNTSVNASDMEGVGFGPVDGVTGLTTAEFRQLDSFAAWNGDIDADGGTGAVWRIYEGRSAPLLRNFLTEIDVIAYDDTKVFNGNPYQGLHQINGTSGNGVRYGTNYAQFLAVFGENGTPYGVSDDLGSRDLEYTGNSQGAINAGTYNLELSELWSHQLGYDIVLNDGTLTITPAGISVTVTVNNASKVYGNADPTFSWAVTNGTLADGDTLTGTLTRQAGENVGNYTIFGNVSGDLASGNYVVTMNNGVFTITPRPITISVADASKIYGNADPDFSWALTSGNLVFGHTLTGNLVRTPGENVGNYAIGANLSGPLASGNYAVTLNQGTLTITPRDIVIDIANLDKIYGETDPEFSWAVTSGGLVEGDALSGTLTRAPGENVGAYTISGVVDGDLANGNYTYTLNNGLLTISPRPVVLTADNLMKVYGEQDPELTWSITSGSLVGDDTLVVSVSREDGSNVGTYAIMLDAGGEAANSNYDLSLVDGQLQITPANLTVTANDVAGYWNLLPPFTATVDGLVNGDTVTSVFGNSLSVISNLAIPVPGNYVLTPIAALIGENYQVNFVDGLLTLLSSNPGGNYIEALTSTQLPAREALGRERRSNIYEARPLLDGSEDGIVLHVLDGGVRLDPDTLAAFGIVFPEAVNFPVNSAVVNERYFNDLRNFVQQLQRYPNVQILVEGHTSSTGSLALNQRLSERRAEAVAKILEDMGLESRRIRTEHFNYQRPVATNDTPEGRYLNQRTEMVEDEQKR